MGALDIGAFINFLKLCVETHGPDLKALVLGGELESLVQQTFFQGKLNDTVSYDTNRGGVISMFLGANGHKFPVRFAPGIPKDRYLLVLEGGLSKPFTGGPNPVYPKTGPGGPNNGGTPVAARKAA